MLTYPTSSDILLICFSVVVINLAACCILISKIKLLKLLFSFSSFFRIETSDICKTFARSTNRHDFDRSDSIIDFNFSVKVESVETDNEQTKDSISSNLDNK